MRSKHMKNPHDDINDNEVENKKFQRTKKKKKKKVFKIILLVILAIIMLVSGALAYKTQKNGGGLQGFLSTMAGHDENTKKNLPELQFLIMGESDTMTDTIMACSYNPNTQKAVMLSIPRDTFVGKSQKNTSPSDKINSKYKGNYEKKLELINDLTGLNMKYYVSVDTKALREVVDTIGGVEFEVPIDMDYDDTSQNLHIHLKKGFQKLDGNKSEQVVRFRHNNDGSTYPSEYGEQDIGRMRTQREFITAALKQTLKPGNIFKIGNFIDIAHKNLKTNMPISVMKDYIPYAVEFSTENIQTETLPGEAKMLGKYSFFLKDSDATEELICKLFFPVLEGTIINESSPKIELLNGTDDFENTVKVLNLLRSKGYNITKIGNTTSTQKTTIKYKTSVSTELENISPMFPNVITQKTKGKSDTDITIIIGKNYK